MRSILFMSQKADTPSSDVMKTSPQIRQDFSEAPNLTATIVMDGGLTRAPVSVMNLSRTNAQIEVHYATELPPTLSLLVNNRLELCEVIWQFAQFAGLRFSIAQAV
ncbi:hypothetical protein [Devosia sp. 2618]|uniref:hypothetical protein n=1 Tax=Devosia sp. 2618 TaxID=3156454 RepID=UPI0033984D13